MVEIKNRWTREVIKTVDAADLYDADLRSANLCSANLCGANLCDADLRSANLCDANLYDADLRSANLCGANLCGANLCDANLCGANLCGANLRGADLRGADLRGADLRGAKRYIDGDVAITLRGSRPILVLGPLGSRDDYMLALITSAGVRVECGCFRGTPDEFKAAVEKRHVDNPRHRDEYMAAVRMIKTWAKAELKFVAEWERDNTRSEVENV